MTSSSNPIVCVINDHPSECESLAQVARSIGWQCESFSSAHDFLAHPRPFTPSCLIADISLSDMDGLELQQRLSAERPEISIIFVSDRCDVRIAVRAMKAGATEFLTKPYDRDLLLSALRQGLRRSEAVLGRETELRTLRSDFGSLTPREREVMTLVVSGLLNKQVGGELGISEITVKAHRGNVMRKMKADSLAALVNMAGRLRITRQLLTSAA
jgi:FixJ family two-component response regulator